MKESSLQHLLLFFSLASPIFSRSYPIPYNGYSDDDTVINVFPEEYGAPPPHWPEGEEPVDVGQSPLLLPYDEKPTVGGYGVPPLPQDTEGAEGANPYYSNGLTGDSANPVGSDDGHSKFPDVESIPILGPEIIDGSGGAGDELYPTEELVAYGHYTADGRLVWDDEPYTTGEPPPFDVEDYDGAGAPGYGSDGYGEESPIWTPDEEQYGGAGYGRWFPEDGSAGSGVGYGIGELPNFEVVPKVVPGYGGYGGYGEETPVEMPEEPEPMGPLPGDGGYGGYGEETPVEMPEEPEPMGPLPGDGGYGGYGEETPVEMPEEPEPMGPLPGDGGYGTDNGGLEVDVEVPNTEGEEPGFPELFPELCDPNGNWDCILYRR